MQRGRCPKCGATDSRFYDTDRKYKHRALKCFTCGWITAYVGFDGRVHQPLPYVQDWLLDPEHRHARDPHDEPAPSARDTAILLLAAQGYSDRHIGHVLGLSPKYVRNRFTTDILPKYKARNRTEAVTRAMMLGHLSLTPPD